MKTIFLLTLVTIQANLIIAQDARYYTNSKGQEHLAGDFPAEILTQDSIFQSWYSKGYQDFTLSTNDNSWKKQLKDSQVTIYLGTWCGDSKYWVPRFVKLWDELGLKREQLKFVALYDFSVDGKYKQGPKAEEKDKDIHRVPTFIFERNQKEFARIVESPVNSLETDLAQIALGFPSEPNYQVATYMINLLKTHSRAQVIVKEETIYEDFRRKIKNLSELSTLGYVYLESDRVEEALTIFYLNTLFFKHDPGSYYSYARALAQTGQIEEAIKNYEKVLLLDRSHQRAQEQLESLRQ